jgi:hypothetical protein
MVIIYLAATLLLQSCCLPFGIGRAALKRRFTWHYSTQGLPNLCITAKTRELLPHVFILTPLLSYCPDSYRDIEVCQQRSGNFLWPCLFPGKPGSRLLTGVLLFAVRTFLSAIKRNDNPADSPQR